MSKRAFFPAFLVPFALVSGCALIGAEVDEDATYAQLPTGVTLLDSEQDECDGIVQVAERTALRRGSDDLVIRRGQNATFEVDLEDDDVSWSCIGESGTDERDEVDCPDATSHVRITREAEGDNFVLECYGDRDRR
jgi:hypothetical protein